MRLIDADALKEDLTRFYDNEVTARDLIDEQPTVGEWISVQDRLPEHGATVLTYSPRGRMRVAQAYIPSTILGSYYDPKECWWNLGGNAGKFVKVTHWMPLPEPPLEVSMNA